MSKADWSGEMSKEIDVNKVMTYWIESSERDFKAVTHLFKSKDYSWSLFIGHLVVEKLFKACFVKVTRQYPPMIHNLVKLAELANIRLDEEKKILLTELTSFNIAGRYDDEKRLFYDKSTRVYTTRWIKNIKLIRKWIKEEHLK